MDHLHDRQQQLLRYLNEHNEGATIEELVSYLGITKSAVREHLSQLEMLEYIQIHDVKGRIGRPRKRYTISEDGRAFGPRQYKTLLKAMVGTILSDYGATHLKKLMSSMGEQVAATLQESLKGRSGKERFDIICEAMNDLGYRMLVRQADQRKGAVLEASNCVYHSAAKAHPELCEFDLSFLRTTTGMQVELTKCISDGDAICRFCFSD